MSLGVASCGDRAESPSVPTEVSARALITIGGLSTMAARDPFVAASNGALVYLSSFSEPGVIEAFDLSTGRSAAGTYAVGEGPTEIGPVRALVSLQDGIGALDVGNSRFVFLSESLEILASFRVPFEATDVRASSTEEVVFAGRYPSKSGSLHVLDRSGQHIRSFGPTPNSGAWWHLGPSAAPGEFWAARSDRYLLTKWGLAGTPLDTISGGSWFRGEELIVDPDRPPGHTIQGVGESTDSLLWVLITVPDPDWSESLRRSPDGGWDIVDWNGFFDTVIEVFDTRSGDLVARSSVDPFLQELILPGLAASYLEDESGIPYVEIWDLGLDASRPN